MPTPPISSERTSRPKARIALLAILATCAVACERTRLVDYEMTWSRSGDPDRIILTFREFPNHYVDLGDDELRRYLESLGSDTVAVQLAVTTRLGCLERIRTTRIGERADWDRVWGASGWVGSENPSPWDRFECKIPWWRPGAGIDIRF